MPPKIPRRRDSPAAKASALIRWINTYDFGSPSPAPARLDSRGGKPAEFAARLRTERPAPDPPPLNSDPISQSGSQGFTDPAILAAVKANPGHVILLAGRYQRYKQSGGTESKERWMAGQLSRSPKPSTGTGFQLFTHAK